jgi:hypothetical protein
MRLMKRAGTPRAASERATLKGAPPATGPSWNSSTRASPRTAMEQEGIGRLVMKITQATIIV